MIMCNCCNTDNAPLARYKDYWICEDCLEEYGSYDCAVNHIGFKSFWNDLEKKLKEE